MKTYFQYQEASAKVLAECLAGIGADAPDEFEKELFLRIMDRIAGSTKPAAVADLLMDAHSKTQEAWAHIDPEFAVALGKDVSGKA